MTPYTHDVESLIMRWDDLAAFGAIVTASCLVHEQHAVSMNLERVTYPWSGRLIDAAVLRAHGMWRTSVLSRGPGHPDPDTV